MDLRQVNAQQAIRRGPDLEVRRVHLPSFGPDFGEVANIVPLVDFERLERDFQLTIAFEDFGLVKVVQCQTLAKGEDVLIPPVSRQGGADCLHGRFGSLLRRSHFSRLEMLSIRRPFTAGRAL